MGTSSSPTSFSADRAAVSAFMELFFEALSRSGVQEVAISPGSRSTPLAVAASRTAGLRTRVIVDERSAAFFALGAARQSQAPAALICTSGTAAANYLPAVVEAHQARVPLLVLTADRPPELRDWGAGQTIDQVGLYGVAVRRFVDVPPPSADPAALRYAAALASRAVADTLRGPAGPVHLNFPLREPLEPPSGSMREEDSVGSVNRAFARISSAPRQPDRVHLQDLVRRTQDCQRGLISCGPLAPGQGTERAIARLSACTGWPILADPTSQVRRGPQVEEAIVLAHSDLWLRDEQVAGALAPDVVLRFGDSPVSKSLRRSLLERPPQHLVLVDPDAVFHDPDHLCSDVLRADPVVFTEAWIGEHDSQGSSSVSSGYAETLQRVDLAAARELRAWLSAEHEMLEPHVVGCLGETLPGDATLFVSNSMPVRDLDAFLPVHPRPLRVLSQRGASGIDGLVSGAAGASAAGSGPVVLFSGDLALLHDVGGLLAARDHALSLTLVVIQNDGGGIFSFLPIAEQGDAVDFERLFRTPHGLDLEHAARLYGLGFERVRDRDGLEAALRAAVSQHGVHLIEVPVDRDANIKRYREGIARVCAAAREALV